jgi:hypothetical protein
LPQPLFQKVVEHHLIAGFTGSHRAVWTNEVAESWRAILLRSCEEHRHEKSLRLLMESTAFCLHNPRLPVGAVVSFTFPVVYEAVVSNRAPSITDEMFGYFEWDKAKKLRKDLIAAYVSSCWPPEDLAWIAAKCQILRKVFNRLRRKWNSDEYIQQMVEGLKCGNTTESLALWQDLSTMMNDSDFFEPWD